MNPDNNIIKFFRKRLIDEAPNEDGWNVPSDDIWNSAKEQFPKKKKERGGLFFLFGGLFGLLLGMGLYAWFGTERLEQHSLTSTKIAKEEKQLVSEAIEITNENRLVSNSSTSKEELSLFENKEIASNNEQVLNKVPLVDGKSTKKIFHHYQEEENTMVEPSPKIYRDINLAVESENLNNQKLNSGSTLATKSSSTMSQSITKQTSFGQKKIDVIEQLPGLKLSSITIIKQNDAKSKTAFQPPSLNSKLSLATKINSFPIHKWEVGLSYAPFFLNIDEVIVEESNEQSVTVIQSLSSQNFHFHLNRRLNRKLSLSSGLHFVDLKLNIDFDYRDIYTESDSLGAILLRRSSPGAISINGEESPLDVDFIESANMQYGDSIQIIGSLPLELKVFQLPILLNYHIPKGRFDFTIRAGLSLDFLIAEVETLDFNIFKEGAQVNEPVQFEKIKEDILVGSLYGGFGVRYHLKNNFSLGANTLLDLGAINLSRLELGVYYGF